jgi:hypothetical protein
MSRQRESTKSTEKIAAMSNMALCNELAAVLDAELFGERSGHYRTEFATIPHMPRKLASSLLFLIEGEFDGSKEDDLDTIVIENRETLAAEFAQRLLRNGMRNG